MVPVAEGRKPRNAGCSLFGISEPPPRALVVVFRVDIFESGKPLNRDTKVEHPWQ